MLKIFKIVILLSVIVAAGCASSHKQMELVEVPVPIETPVAQLPPEPWYPVKDLNDKSTDVETMKAYIVTVYLLKAQNEICRNQLRQYGRVQNSSH